MGMRRKGRELALQVLYSLDFPDLEQKIDAYEALNNYHEQLTELCVSESVNANSSVYTFTEELIKNTLINQEAIDEVIVEQCDNWEFSRLAVVDRNILRMAAYEIIYKRVHPAIIINEAIEIAKKFSTEKSGKFINGVLDSVYKKAKLNFEENA